MPGRKLLISSVPANGIWYMGYGVVCYMVFAMASYMVYGVAWTWLRFLFSLRRAKCLQIGQQNVVKTIEFNLESGKKKRAGNWTLRL